jgi:protoporphyrinogen oxidase
LAQLPDDALAGRVVEELVHTGLLRAREVIEWRHHLLPNAYPVYHLGWERQVAIVIAALGAIRNLDLLGRGGLFFYSHLHDQLRLGKSYVRDLAPMEWPESPLGCALADSTEHRPG